MDTIPPDTLVDSGPPVLSNSSSASFSFHASEASNSFECQLDGGGYTACTPPKGYSALTDGPHTFQVRAKDACGNLDATPASYPWTVDTTAPTNVRVTAPTSRQRIATNRAAVLSGAFVSAAVAGACDERDDMECRYGVFTDSQDGYALPLQPGTYTVLIDPAPSAGLCRQVIDGVVLAPTTS